MTKDLGEQGTLIDAGDYQSGTRGWGGGGGGL